MEVEIKKENGKMTVIPHGRIDSITSDDFDNKVKEKLTSDIKEIVIDMCNVDFISSKGIRIFLGLSHVAQIKGNLSLININNSVREVLKLSDLLKVFNVQ